ncbi:175_t:CDS:2, partial [Paraglomus occultum]
RSYWKKSHGGEANGEPTLPDFDENRTHLHQRHSFSRKAQATDTQSMDTTFTDHAITSLAPTVVSGELSNPAIASSSSNPSANPTLPSTPPPFSLLYDADDPFLLVSLRQARPPRRPKYLPVLFILAFMDFAFLLASVILLLNKQKHDGPNKTWRVGVWDLVALGVVRVIVLVTVSSSIWVRDYGWIVGGACGISTMYVIFKSNLTLQFKIPTNKHHLMIFVTTFIFSLLNWIVYALVTADKGRRARLLKGKTIFFEEEGNANEIVHGATDDNNEQSGLLTDGDENVYNDGTNDEVTRGYGTINTDETENDVYNDNGGGVATAPQTEYIAVRGASAFTRPTTSFSTASVPIPIASSVSSDGSARSFRKYKKKGRPVVSGEVPLHRRKSRDITEEREEGISNTRDDEDNLLQCFDDTDAGLIFTSVGRGGSVKDRDAVYFQPPREDVLPLAVEEAEYISSDDCDDSTAPGTPYHVEYAVGVTGHGGNALIDSYSPRGYHVGDIKTSNFDGL